MLHNAKFEESAIITISCQNVAYFVSCLLDCVENVPVASESLFCVVTLKLESMATISFPYLMNRN
uniref:Uncharacterized protein n=1 Tax=Rhizophora mucronata TaxID=61149 RepID=A0A2P2PF93_RHIMU